MNRQQTLSSSSITDKWQNSTALVGNLSKTHRMEKYPRPHDLTAEENIASCSGYQCDNLDDEWIPLVDTLRYKPSNSMLKNIPDCILPTCLSTYTVLSVLTP